MVPWSRTKLSVGKRPGFVVGLVDVDPGINSPTTVVVALATAAGVEVEVGVGAVVEGVLVGPGAVAGEEVARLKLATAVWERDMVRLQTVPVAELQSWPQEVKAKPKAGEAVKVAVEPPMNEPEQLWPQFRLPLLESTTLTVPLPVPVFEMLSS